MNYHRLLFWVALLLVISAPGECKVVYSYTDTDTFSTIPYYLKYISSPKAVAMGHCSINIVDERSPLTNPGGLGIFHLDKAFGISFPNRTNWLYQSTRLFSMKSIVTSVGISKRFNHVGAKNPFKLSIGLAGAHIESITKVYNYDYWHYYPRQVYSYRPIDYDIYSVALGVEYIFRFGIGYSYKYLQTRSQPLWDAGLILEIPVMKFFEISIPVNNNSSSSLGFIFTPSIAYVAANPGDAPSTKMYRLGLGNLCGVTLNSAELITGRFLRENEAPSQTISIDRYHKTGFEIGLIGFFFYRWGGIKNIVTAQDTDTYGLGFSLHGLLAISQALDIINFRRGVKRYLLQHFDISFDYARSNDLRFANPSRIKFSLSF
jgi:hypothetical protein